MATVCRELLVQHDLSDATYAKLVNVLGESQVFEPTALVGY